MKRVNDQEDEKGAPVASFRHWSAMEALSSFSLEICLLRLASSSATFVPPSPLMQQLPPLSLLEAEDFSLQVAASAAESLWTAEERAAFNETVARGDSE